MTLDPFDFSPSQQDLNRITAVGYVPTQADVAKAVQLIYATAQYVSDLAEEIRTYSKHDDGRLRTLELAYEKITGIEPVKAIARVIEAVSQPVHVPQFGQPVADTYCTCALAVKVKDAGTNSSCLLCGHNAANSKYVFSHTAEGQALLDPARGSTTVAPADIQQPTNVLAFPGQPESDGSAEDDIQEGEYEVETEPPPYEHELIEAIAQVEMLPTNMEQPRACTCNPSPMAVGDDHGVDGEYCPVCGGV